MSKVIYFIRTAPYDYQIKDTTLYQSFNAVAKKEVEISLKKNAKVFFLQNIPKKILTSKNVLCSPRKRSIESAKVISSSIEILPDLIEIEFQMENFISEKEFYGLKKIPNVQKARKSFVNSLIKNKLDEHYQDLIYRIEHLLNILRTKETKTLVLFTHGFFMKVLEAYVRDNSIKQDPKRLLKYFDGSTETFKFCEGFYLEMNDETTIFKQYIRNKEAQNGK